MGGKTKTTTTNPNAVSQYKSAVSTLGNSSYKPVSSEQISGYMNPYTSSVIDATLARSNQNQQLALNGNQDNAIRSGAFGGTGLSVQNALTQGQYDMNNQATIAGLNSDNYDQALQTAVGQNQAANQYPLAIQALLGQLAQGTTTNSTSKAPTDWAGIVKAIGSTASTVAAL